MHPADLIGWPSEKSISILLEGRKDLVEVEDIVPQLQDIDLELSQMQPGRNKLAQRLAELLGVLVQAASQSLLAIPYAGVAHLSYWNNKVVIETIGKVIDSTT